MNCDNFVMGKKRTKGYTEQITAPKRTNIGDCIAAQRLALSHYENFDMDILFVLIVLMSAIPPWVALNQDFVLSDKDGKTAGPSGSTVYCLSVVARVARSPLYYEMFKHCSSLLCLV